MPSDLLPAGPPADPVGSSLRGRHARLGLRVGAAVRFAPDVAPFLALPAAVQTAAGTSVEEAWADVRRLLVEHGPAAVALPDRVVAPTGISVQHTAARQLVAPSGFGAADPEAVVLGPADVPEMEALVARTKPGPFFARTIEMGRYVGIRREGELVALAGERMHAAGWREVSAVCTDPAWRGRGFAGRLIGDVAAATADRLFLHVVDENAAAIATYERLGFTTHRPMTFSLVRAA